MLSLYIRDTDAEKIFTPDFQLRLNHYHVDFSSLLFPNVVNSMGQSLPIRSNPYPISRSSRQTLLDPSDYYPVMKRTNKSHSCSILSLPIDSNKGVLALSCFRS